MSPCQGEEELPSRYFWRGLVPLREMTNMLRLKSFQTKWLNIFVAWPSASMTTTKRLLQLVTKCWRAYAGIAAQVSLQWMNSLSNFVGFLSCTLFFNPRRRFSIASMSGFCGGHCCAPTRLWSRHWFILLAVCWGVMVMLECSGVVETQFLSGGVHKLLKTVDMNDLNVLGHGAINAVKFTRAIRNGAGWQHDASTPMFDCGDEMPWVVYDWNKIFLISVETVFRPPLIFGHHRYSATTDIQPPPIFGHHRYSATTDIRPPPIFGHHRHSATTDIRPPPIFGRNSTVSAKVGLYRPE